MGAASKGYYVFIGEPDGKQHGNKMELGRPSCTAIFALHSFCDKTFAYDL